ncbi:gp080 [Rhodococcus phage ReqiPoco6]|uniref:Gp080 n=1 Tax=Rhodococcus phage ReqiPoco6 TaxID=691964 RepID=D4P7U8_9CAUD|nr:gp080 [Rhodococcus phage ReqiPoco6]ADD81078.1 gp080 [Rhodococcus phage ReqiPoco6]
MSDKNQQRPNKLYFETVKEGVSEGQYYWVLKSPNGKIIGSSHYNYKTLDSAINNCIAILNIALVASDRISIETDQETREKIVKQCRDKFDIEWAA